jgi:hypothetical protein
MNLASSQIIPPRLMERLTLSVVNLVLLNTKRKRLKKNRLLYYINLQFFVSKT